MKSWDGNGYARHTPPLDAEHLALLREALRALLRYESAREPDAEDGFSDLAQRVTHQLYHEGWQHYGYDQEEGLLLLARPELLATADPLQTVRALYTVHRADYWSGGQGSTAWADYLVSGAIRALHDRLDRLIAAME